MVGAVISMCRGMSTAFPVRRRLAEESQSASGVFTSPCKSLNTDNLVRNDTETALNDFEFYLLSPLLVNCTDPGQLAPSNLFRIVRVSLKSGFFVATSAANAAFSDGDTHVPDSLGW